MSLGCIEWEMCSTFGNFPFRDAVTHSHHLAGYLNPHGRPKTLPTRQSERSGSLDLGTGQFSTFEIGLHEARQRLSSFLNHTLLFRRVLSRTFYLFRVFPSMQ